MSGYREAQPPGFEKTPDLRTWESTAPCPRCGFELFCGEKDGIEVSACGHCGGVWLRTEQAKRAIATGSRVPEELARKVERVTRARPWKETAGLICPECKGPMQRSKIGHVVIDLCAHGTWFDRTELKAVMHHMRGEPEPSKGVEETFMREQADRKKWGPLSDLVGFFQELLAKDPKKT
jgi:Zn-finger nucleic acid-binding protein